MVGKRYSIAVLAIILLNLIFFSCSNRNRNSSSFISSINSQIFITQSSSVSPDRIEANGGKANTYNWDQTIALEKGGYKGTGVIHYTLDGSEPAADSSIYSGPFTLTPDDGEVIITAVYVEEDGEVGEKVSARYIIDYDAYNHNFKLKVMKGDELVAADNMFRYQASDDIDVYIEYTPVCGETYSIYKGNSVREITKNFKLGTEENFHEKMEAPILYNRKDIISDPVKLFETEAVSEKLYSVEGRDFEGGTAQQIKAYLVIDRGKEISEDPQKLKTDNPDLVTGENLKEALCYVVYPEIILAGIYMYDRPEITPYLWTKSEPVAQVDVLAKDFFTGEATSVKDVTVYYAVQYAEKDKPYRDTVKNIYWTGTNISFMSPEDIISLNNGVKTGQGLEVIDTDPAVSGMKYGHKKNIQAVEGRAFFQIDNPYDEYKIGEPGHYSEIDDDSKTGALNEKAFRTVVRFCVTAREKGFRDPQNVRGVSKNILHSFNSNRCANFDTKVKDGGKLNSVSSFNPSWADDWSNRRFAHGVHSKAEKISDMPEGYRSYPIEVCEGYEGWTLKNHLSTAKDGGGYVDEVPYYTKTGVVWMGKDREGVFNTKDFSTKQHFSYDRKKMLIFTFGWATDGVHEICVIRNRKFTTDGRLMYIPETYTETEYSKWKNSETISKKAGSEFEWGSNKWIARGYNAGHLHFHKYFQEKREFLGHNVPGGAERKVFVPTAGDIKHKFRMGFYPDDILEDHVYSDAMGDCIRSASLGLMAAQEIVDSIPDDYVPEIITVVGHSLGSQIMLNASEKIIRAADAGKVPLYKVPDRIDLFDPFFGKNGWEDIPGITNPMIFTYLASHNCQIYADRIHKWSSEYGDDIDGEGPVDNKGIPIQFYKSSSLTQDVMGLAVDRNIGMLKKTNYVKFNFHNSIDEKHGGGYVPAGSDSIECHAEVAVWYLASTSRTQDSLLVFGDEDIVSGNSYSGAISAASGIDFLWKRLASMREMDNWQWYEQQDDEFNDTFTADDDNFVLREYNMEKRNMSWIDGYGRMFYVR